MCVCSRFASETTNQGMNAHLKRSTVLSVVIPLSLLVRYAVSLQGYSGEGNAEGRTREDGTPMFGDYEAQRHWMELTLHLSPEDWYHETKDNDLLYWGLDYPPLTAWHSKLCGYILNLIEPESVALRSSRFLSHYPLVCETGRRQWAQKVPPNCLCCQSFGLSVSVSSS